MLAGSSQKENMFWLSTLAAALLYVSRVLVCCFTDSEGSNTDPSERTFDGFHIFPSTHCPDRTSKREGAELE